MERLIHLTQENQRLRARLDAERRTTASLQTALEHQRREALTDPLTGLYNRRAMDQRLGEIWAVPDATPLALLVLDIDFFKRINDTYGHAEGDCVIRWVAATLCRCVRAGDRAFRFGGEEFLVLLPDTTLDGAIKVAESIRRRIEVHHLAFPRNWQVPLTVSLGVASRQDKDDPVSLFERADRALYQAKHRGRNQVVHENCLS
jgi:diguanylate cyclase (GGDEF)-like protein